MPVSAPRRTFSDLKGNPFNEAWARKKHFLKIDPPWRVDGAHWEARAIELSEAVRQSKHVITCDDLQVNGKDLKIGWWYSSVNEASPILPQTMHPTYSEAVRFDESDAETGIQINAQTDTTSKDPGYRFWVDGMFRGAPVSSETVAIGAEGDHVALSVHWELVFVDANGDEASTIQVPTIPNPGPGNSVNWERVAEIAAEFERLTFELRQLSAQNR